MDSSRNAKEIFLKSLERGAEQRQVTYDLSALRGLSGEERDEAEGVLMLRAREGDVIAIETMGFAQVRGARGLLYELVSKEGDVGMAAARALMSLGERTEDLIAEGMDKAGGVQSAFAAFDLQKVEGPMAVEGLLKALEQKFLPTRINGLDGLEKRMPEIPKVYREVNMTPYGNLAVRLLVEIPAVWLPAARELQVIWRHLISGRSPDALGLEYTAGNRDLVNDYWASTRGEAPWNIEFVKRMSSGHDRVWAETYALFRAGQRNRWAVDAIGRLGLKHEREAMEQLKVASTSLRDPDWHETLDRTIDALA